MLRPIVETYNQSEEYLYSKQYCFIKGFAVGRNYTNLLKALPLARQMHNGQYRKGLTEVNGEKVHLPYVLHVLKVCSTLINLAVPFTDEELDVLYTCAILHDVLEDASEYFPNGGMELVQVYGFPKDVLEVILLLSKRSGASEEELNDYFNKIKMNKYALLIKLADRSHNVEDLYNMKNIPKYINETRTYILNGLCSYGKSHYPELSEGITTLKSKILSLTETVEVMQEKIEAKNLEIEAKNSELVVKDAEIDELKAMIEKIKNSKTE